MEVEQVSFDLVDEPWLPVRRTDGTACEVGLAEALVKAHEIAGLDIEFPTQEPALLRLLLAVCYRALEGPVDDHAWDALWAAGSLPEGLITGYLDRWRDRFDLFHPTSPFFQSPQLEPAGKGGIKPASKLIAHAPSGNNVPVFTPITEHTDITLRPAEAARWLTERHAWGTTSDKTGAKGNPRAEKSHNHTDTPKLGHLSWIGFVAPIGTTLRETLLLNLVPWSRTALVTSGPADLPAWERPPTGPVRDERPPEGACDLFTWQGRRVRLFPERRAESVVVSRVLICAGDDVERDAVRTVDPHTGWRSTKRPDGTLAFSPIRARLRQQVWRGLSALLALDEGTERAGVLSWLAAREDRGMTRVSLLVTAVEFTKNFTVLEDLVSDRLDTAVAILRTIDLEAATLATDAASFAEQAVRALWHVANAPFLVEDHEPGRYRVPEGKSGSAGAARKAIGEEFYGELDAPFRRLLVDLAVPSYRSSVRPAWADQVAAVAREIARRNLARRSATDAFSGAMADAWFVRDLGRARRDFAPSEITTEPMEVAG